MKEIVCNGCSLVCDDVLAETAKEETRSLGICRLGHAHLERAVNLSESEAILREGSNEVGLKLGKALDKAAGILIKANHPLLYGWSRCTNEAIEEGLALAATLKATFDSHASMGLAQSMHHKIHDLKLETDLEVVLNRGEFIVYWGSNPIESSHRHASRFTVFPRGENAPQGVESRVVGVIDVQETETMKMANHRIIIPHGGDSELAKALVADLTGKTPLKTSILGLPAATLVGLSQALRKSDFTVVFYGTGFVNSGKTKENLSALDELVHTLRGLGKEAYAMPMYHEPNEMGIVKSLVEKFNSPAALDFSTGQPNSISSKATLQKLANGEFDVALIVGYDALISLPGLAAKGLAKTTTIYVGPAGGITDNMSLLSLRACDDILSGVGTITRIDMKDVQLVTWGDTKQSAKNTFEVVSDLHRMIQTKLNNG
ncbi:MAG: hypothetical protein EAX95_11435 [Candidatus Thorarchaeota archaeon]|nr:hypothetical protein [Candidatus Thorarchaeota archaeon]